MGDAKPYHRLDVSAATAHDEAVAHSLYWQDLMDIAEAPPGRALYEALAGTKEIDSHRKSGLYKVLAGAGGDVHGNEWYEALARETQKVDMEASRSDDATMEEAPAPLEASRSEASDQEPIYSHPHPAVAGVAGEERKLVSFMKKWGAGPSDLDPDEPSQSSRPPRVLPLRDDDVPKFDCGICLETKLSFDRFHGSSCEHAFCLECMVQYIDLKVREGEVPVRCPDPACQGQDRDAGLLHPEECKKSVDFGSFGEWGLRLAEHALPPSRRAYCPFPHCGVLLETSGGAAPAMAPCPVCLNLLCAKCGQPWAAPGGKHDCDGGLEAALARKLASERRWKACPRCKMMIEKSFGCRVMRCRCGFVFCYQCGCQFSQEWEGRDECKC